MGEIHELFVLALSLVWFAGATLDLLNPQVRTNFVAFPFEKNHEVRFDFGPRPGFSKQLFGSSREGTELDWTYFKQFRF